MWHHRKKLSEYELNYLHCPKTFNNVCGSTTNPLNHHKSLHRSKLTLEHFKIMSKVGESSGKAEQSLKQLY